MLKSVKITSNCYKTCITHAMLSENEEIMGLLIGNIEKNVAVIWDVCMLNRTYKKKDRVEISSSDLVNAAKEAEKMSRSGKKTRVIGWYHSHPHITPWPSHVDLQCQANYQLMDKGFVGLIFSVYNYLRNKSSKIELYGFQSVKKKKGGDSRVVKVSRFERRDLELEIIKPPESYMYPNNSIKRIIDLQEIIFKEEKKEFVDATKKKNKSLTKLINISIYQYNLMKLIQKFGPLKKSIARQIQNQKKHLERLKKEEKSLLSTPK